MVLKDHVYVCAHSIRTSAPKRVRPSVCTRLRVHLKATLFISQRYRYRTCIQWTVPFPCQIQWYDNVQGTLEEFLTSSLLRVAVQFEI